MDFKHKELIIFDFDGTLINSIPDLTRAINTMLSHYNLPNLTVQQVTPFVGNGAKPLVQRALNCSAPNIKLSEKYLKEAFNIYFSAYKAASCVETYTYPGVNETLKHLFDRGYKMAICTNKPFGFIESILDKLNIKQYFNLWIGEDSLPEKKPSAAPLLHIADKMHINIEKCLMVGDSKNDINAAQNANMESVGVSYGYNYNENIATYNPTVVIDRFSDLKELL